MTGESECIAVRLTTPIESRRAPTDAEAEHVAHPCRRDLARAPRRVRQRSTATRSAPPAAATARPASPMPTTTASAPARQSSRSGSVSQSRRAAYGDLDRARAGPPHGRAPDPSSSAGTPVKSWNETTTRGRILRDRGRRSPARHSTSTNSAPASSARCRMRAPLLLASRRTGRPPTTRGRSRPPARAVRAAPRPRRGRARRRDAARPCRRRSRRRGRPAVRASWRPSRFRTAVRTSSASSH